MKTLIQFLTEKWEHPYTGKELLADPSDEERIHPIHSLTDRLRAVYTFGHEGGFYDNKSPEVEQRLKPITDYTDDSGQINTSLIDHYKKSKENPEAKLSPTRQAQVDKLREGVTMHRTPEDLHVYSGVGFSPREYAEPGQSGPIKVHLPAFTSTSLMPNVAEKFSHYTAKYPDPHSKYGKPVATIIKIHVPQGSAGAFIADHSHHHDEREFLIPNGAQLHIHPEPTIEAPNTASHEYHIWHAKLVHDGVQPTRHANEET